MATTRGVFLTVFGTGSGEDMVFLQAFSEFTEITDSGDDGGVGFVFGFAHLELIVELLDQVTDEFFLKFCGLLGFGDIVEGFEDGGADFCDHEVSFLDQ
jgi:hypothetical protein